MSERSWDMPRTAALKAAGLPYPRITTKGRRMAHLFVHGPPGIRGNWGGAAREAGYVTTPARDNLSLNYLIHEEGGTPPSPEVLKALVPATPAADPPSFSVDDLELPDPDDPDAQVKWKALARSLLPTFIGVGKGEIELRPVQERVLKEIMARGFGKAGTQTAEDNSQTASHVVVLPTLVRGDEILVCPKCGTQIDEAFTNGE